MIVLANGVFDVLHIGHVNHLKQARKMGDRLIVGVTIDDCVHKGPGRPVFSIRHRMKMLQELRCVDEVFGVQSSLHALMIAKPNIFVKGREYEHAVQQEDRKFCEAHGIEIRFTDGQTYSSTALLYWSERDKAPCV